MADFAVYEKGVPFEGYTPEGTTPNKMYYDQYWNWDNDKKEIISSKWDSLKPGDYVIISQVEPGLYLMEVFGDFADQNYSWLFDLQDLQDSRIRKLIFGY